VPTGEEIPTTGAGSSDPTCDSCGRSGDDRAAVRRQYVTMDDRGRVTGAETVDEVEMWCPACRAAYPHEPDDQHPGAPSS
jgi:hypothetical protein